MCLIILFIIIILSIIIIYICCKKKENYITALLGPNTTEAISDNVTAAFTLASRSSKNNN
tara:strand:+ start:287 stop:466 length:180 start_codon:yes stop_codon:yes gene_type:complete